MDHALLIICGLLINLLLGGPRHLHKALGLTALFRKPADMLRDLERKLNRENRSESQREGRGLVVVVALVVGSLLTGWLLGFILRPSHGLGDMLLLACLIPVRQCFDIGYSIRKALLANNTAAARSALEDTAWRHHAIMDNHALARAAIETQAVNFSDKILTPVLAYLLFGLSGLFTVKAITLLQEVLAKPGVSETEFARAARWLYNVIIYMPSRIAAILFMLAAAFNSNPRLNQAATHLGDATLPPQQFILTIAAVLLNLTLGGPVSIYTQGAWIEAGPVVKALPADIGRMLYVFCLGSLLVFTLTGLMLL